MSHGLEIYNSLGGLDFSSSYRLARYHSLFTISIPVNTSNTPVSSNYSVPGMLPNTQWGVLNIPSVCNVRINTNSFTLYTFLNFTAFTAYLQVIRV